MAGSFHRLLIQPTCNSPTPPHTRHFSSAPLPPPRDPTTKHHTSTRGSPRKRLLHLLAKNHGTHTYPGKRPRGRRSQTSGYGLRQTTIRTNTSSGTRRNSVPTPILGHVHVQPHDAHPSDRNKTEELNPPPAMEVHPLGRQPTDARVHTPFKPIKTESQGRNPEKPPPHLPIQEAGP
jgi:hypothetical protein